MSGTASGNIKLALIEAESSGAFSAQSAPGHSIVAPNWSAGQVTAGQNVVRAEGVEPSWAV